MAIKKHLILTIAIFYIAFGQYIYTQHKKRLYEQALAKQLDW
jgi:cbb3-type cytochrome oxidase subunit 3